MDKEDGESREFCEGCHVGSLQPCWATYARWHEEQFVIVPRVPAWRCDFCGDTFYDDEAMTRLAMLLGPESDLGDERRWRTTGLEGRGEAGLGSRRRV
jgi:YgiT-type zinc finger domain-containing protein